MKAKPVLLLVVALGCGLVAMLGVQQVMSGPKPKEEAVDETQVLVATQEIAPFSSLDDSNTKLMSVPSSALPDPDAVVTSRDEVLDKKLRGGASEGEYIYRSRLVDKNYSPSREIPQGMRVVTVKVNATKSHSGLLRPGDRVDVVLTYKAYRQGRQPVQRTVTILQYVEVFALDSERITTMRDAQGNEIKAKNVSLLCKPEHGNLLMLAEARGQLTLALRTGEDSQQANVKPVDDQIFEKISKGGMSDKTDALEALKENPGQNGKDRGNQAAGNKNTNGQTTGQPTWKLTIYSGSTPRVEEVYAPAAQNAAPRRTAPRRSKPSKKRATPKKRSV